MAIRNTPTRVVDSVRKFSFSAAGMSGLESHRGLYFPTTPRKGLLMPSRQIRSAAFLVALMLGILGISSSSHAFTRGDVDGGGQIDLADAVAILTQLFDPSADPFECADAADTNDDGSVDISDGVFLLAFLFVPGSPSPAAPYPIDGPDPTPDTLPPCDVLGILGFETIAQGAMSGVTDQTRSVIDNDQDWADFWALHSPEPLPPVDFATEMVVVILSQFDSFGVTYTVNEIEDLGATVEIRFTVVLPGVYFPEVNQPHHIVRVERSSATPVFVETVIALP